MHSLLPLQLFLNTFLCWDACSLAGLRLLIFKAVQQYLNISFNSNRSEVQASHKWNMKMRWLEEQVLLKNIFEGNLFSCPRPVTSYRMIIQGKEQPEFIYLDTGKTNSSTKPLGLKPKLAKPKGFQLKSQLVEDIKPKRVAHMVRHCCIYFSLCSQGFQQQIWADEHQQTWVPIGKERFMSTRFWFRKHKTQLKQTNTSNTLGLCCKSGHVKLD